MANHKQAEKRNRQRDKRRALNRNAIGRMRTALKQARTAIEGKAGEKESLVKSAVQLVDKAVSRGALKRTTAARTISRLVRAARK